MKNMEREKFEESLKNAFDNAEISPSDKVWTNIELGLEKAKGGDLKRRLMFYQMLAAASVVFAMAIGGAGYYYSLNQKQSPASNVAMETLRPSDANVAPEKSAEEKKPAIEDSNLAAANAQEETSSNSDKTVGPALKDSNTLPGNNQRVADNQNPPVEGKNSIASVQPESKNEGGSNHLQDRRDERSVLVTDANTTNVLDELPRGIESRDLPPLYTPRKIELTIETQKQEVDPVRVMLAHLEQREKELKGEQKDEKNADDQNENLWTSIGFAAGSFSSTQSSYSPSTNALMADASSTYATTAPIVDQETKASGYSYSMGVNMGTKISERWVFQGGVNYLTHASEYTANTAVVARDNLQQRHFRAASTNELVNSDQMELNNKIVHSAPYNINNSMRYLSIPLQAGYLLVNKTFGLQLNAGVATDLFLQNTIKANSDRLDKTSQAGGSDSPYRSVNQWIVRH